MGEEFYEEEIKLMKFSQFNDSRISINITKISLKTEQFLPRARTYLIIIICNIKEDLLSAWLARLYSREFLALDMYVENTHVHEGNPVCREFLQNVRWCARPGQWFPDNVTQLCNELVTLPFLSTFSPPGPPSASSVALERPPRLVSLTLKPLKRSHSRPCSLRRACRSKITFETRAHGSLTLLRPRQLSSPRSWRSYPRAGDLPWIISWNA